MLGKRKGKGEFCREDQWFSKETLYKDHIAERPSGPRRMLGKRKGKGEFCRE